MGAGGAAPGFEQRSKDAWEVKEGEQKPSESGMPERARNPELHDGGWGVQGSPAGEEEEGRKGGDTRAGEEEERAAEAGPVPSSG